MSIELRIKRSFRWEFDARDGPMMYGGDNSYKLVHTDVLQYKESYPTVKGLHEEWVDVPVIEEEKPEHPNEVRKNRDRGPHLGIKSDPEFLQAIRDSVGHREAMQRISDATAILKGKKKVQE